VSKTPGEELKLKYDHLRGLCIPENKDGNYEVHILIGDPTVTDVRTGNCRTGKQGQPIADETLLGGLSMERESTIIKGISHKRQMRTMNCYAI